MDIDKFNNLQMNKVHEHIKKTIKKLNKLHTTIVNYRDKFNMLYDILKKNKKQSKPVSNGIRKTFYTLSYELYTSFTELLKNLSYSEHVTVFIKTEIGEYFEKNIIVLPSLNVYCKDDECIYEIDDNTFSIPQKIKAHIAPELIQKLPENFYIAHPKNHMKYLTTFDFGIYCTDLTVNTLDEMEGSLKININMLQDTLSASASH